MGRPRKGKPLTLRPIRIDDDVWKECQRLREEYGTINEGLRVRLLDRSEQPQVSETAEAPMKLDTKIPPAAEAKLVDTIVAMAVEKLKASKQPPQPWRKASSPLLKPGQKRK